MCVHVRTPGIREAVYVGIYLRRRDDGRIGWNTSVDTIEEHDAHGDAEDVVQAIDAAMASLERVLGDDLAPAA